MRALIVTGALLCATYVAAGEVDDAQLAKIEQRLAAQENRLSLANPDTSYTIGGRIQLDAALNRPSVNGTHLYDYYVTPASFSGDKAFSQLSMQAKESRFWFKTYKKTPDGILRALIEVDFGGTSGTETVSNSHNVRLRHAYITYNGWTLGQTNSAFMGNSAPDVIFLAADVAFVRQPQVRYTFGKGAWQLDASVENPETSIDFNGSKTFNDDAVPDAMIRTRYQGRMLSASVALMARPLTIEHNDTRYGAMAWGMNSSAKYIFENNDYVEGAFAVGEGLGRYMALGYFKDATVRGTTIVPAMLHTMHLSYTHRWNTKMRSTLLGSYIENETLSSWTAHANVRYAPMPQTLFSMEYITGETEDASGVSAIQRMLGSVSYIF